MMTISSADLFVFSQKRMVLVRLPAFEWNFALGLLVRLQSGDKMLDGRQIGTGNHEGKATILLSLNGDWAQAMRVVQAFIASGGTITMSEIERKSDRSVEPVD